MTGSGTSGDPYIITSKADLQAMENNLASYYELGSDIDGSGTGEGFDPILLFTGQLDGKGYTISSLFINRPTEYYVGLIGSANGNIVLKNISLTGVDITGIGTMGALLGYAGSGKVVDIDNCNSAGSITGTNGQVGGLVGLVTEGTIDDCWSSCTVINGSGGDQTGGLIGYNIDAVITNCYATGAVTSADGRVGGLIGEDWTGTLSKCYATGNVSGLHEVGGLIGRVNSNPNIDDCYARGSAAAPTDYYAGGLIGLNDSGVIDDCYSTGAATCVDPNYAGGLIGVNNGTVTNCFWDTETSSNATSDGGTGKTTAQMKTKATFTGAGWDFATPIWYISDSRNNSYPCFLAGAKVFPSDAITRVTNLIHRYNRAEGIYTLEMALGNVTSDFGLPEWTARPRASTPEREQEKVVEEMGIPKIVERHVQKRAEEYYEQQAALRAGEPAAPTARTLRILEEREQEVQRLEEQIAKTRMAAGEAMPVTERTKRIMRESPEARRRLAKIEKAKKPWWQFW